MNDLRGTVTVVTGGASGIGRATVELLRARGAHVCLVDVDPAGAGVAAELGAEFVQADVGDPGGWETVTDLVGSRWERLDGLHLNAGVVTGEPQIERVTVEQYRRLMSVNVDGVVFGIRSTVPLMSRTGGGIVVTSSIGGIRPFPHDPLYAMSKQGVATLVRSLAPQLAGRRITVNAVCPGTVDTAIVQPRTRARLAGLGVPLMPPSHIAEVVVAYLTGTATGEVAVLQVGQPKHVVPAPDVPGPAAPGVDAAAYLDAQETWVVPPAGTSS